MELFIGNLDELQVANLRVDERMMNEAISCHDVKSWERMLRKIMLRYPQALPNPIVIPASFMKSVEQFLEERNDILGSVRQSNDDKPIKFRSVPVVASAAT